MRTILRLALAAVALSFFVPAVRAQGGGTPALHEIRFTYRDGDGQGRLSLLDLGPDAATGGRSIKVRIEQNGVTYNGSGVTLQLEETMPFTTLITFTVVAPSGRSYFFQGKTTSGITLSGQGTWHRVGFPESKFPWNSVLGG
jgi:hypothetical protein